MTKVAAGPVIEATKKTMGRDGSSHFLTLIGERPNGSQWGGDMTEEILELFIATGIVVPHEELSDNQVSEGCVYVKVAQGAVAKLFPNATFDVQTSNNLLRSQIIVVRKSIHEGEFDEDGNLLNGVENKYELQTKVPFDGQVTDEAWVILGPGANGLVIYTTYPGPLLGDMPENWDGNADKLDLYRDAYPVKRFQD
tara:strand:+ start:131 stop:718 length:588 start_codon:yes stop_codon:yes gene_type:complete